jgi:hypothetical protein
MKHHATIASIILFLAFACVLCVAASERQNFIRTFGGRVIQDTSGTTLKVDAVKGTADKPSVSVAWSTGNTRSASTKPLPKEGWFVFVQDISHVWVFDGEALSLLHNTGKSLSDESSNEAFKTCPGEVRNALPESLRKKYFP